MKKFLLALIFIFFTNALYASNYIASYPYILKSTRALGMGNAYYTLSEDQYALFYNPAGLARIKESRYDILNIQGGISKNSIKFYNDVKSTDWDDEKEIADLLDDYNNELQHASLSTFPAYYKKNFAVGLFATFNGDAIPHSIREYPELYTKIHLDYGIAAGYSMSFLDNNSLQVGIAAKYMFRKSLTASYTAADLTEDFEELIKDDIKDGDGLIGDVGIIYNFHFLQNMNPRIGAAVNNIGMTGLGDAEDLKTTLNLSVAISPEFFGKIGSHFLLEFHDATKNWDEDNDLGKRIHAGAEFNFFNNILAVRTGLNQGYLTFGAGLDFNILKIDYAYYTEEIGAYAGQWDDSRHIITLSLGF